MSLRRSWIVCQSWKVTAFLFSVYKTINCARPELAVTLHVTYQMLTGNVVGMPSGFA